jgi:Flp pilus assembly protein TadB
LKLAGAAIVFLILGVIAIVIFDAIWVQVGLGAALAVVFGALLAFGWYVDRKERKRREGLDELPPI